MPIAIEHPLWLLLIVPAGILAIIDALRRLPATRARRGIAIAIRLVIISALALAIAEPSWPGHQIGRAHV